MGGGFPAFSLYVFSARKRKGWVGGSSFSFLGTCEVHGWVLIKPGREPRQLTFWLPFSFLSFFLFFYFLLPVIIDLIYIFFERNTLKIFLENGIFHLNRMESFLFSALFALYLSLSLSHLYLCPHLLLSPIDISALISFSLSLPWRVFCFLFSALSHLSLCTLSLSLPSISLPSSPSLSPIDISALIPSIRWRVFCFLLSLTYLCALYLSLTPIDITALISFSLSLSPIYISALISISLSLSLNI